MRWATSPPFTQIRFFFSSFTARLRVAATTPATTPWGPSPQPTQEGRLQPRLGARKLPRRCCLFPLAPTPTAAIACTRGHASKVMFFFFFFSFLFFFFSFLFLPLERPLFPTCRVLKPPPLHRVPPLKPRKSRRRHRGHASKDMFFSFLFFSFLF